MSIQETKSVPNVYKTEKFVILDTIDTYGNLKLASTKPNLLECAKVYTAFDDNGNIKEFIDTGEPYKIAVPLSLWQVDPSASNTVDEGGNSLICPPYICSDIKMLEPKRTLSSHIENKRIHRGSIIYATKRDSGIDVFGHGGRGSGIYVKENVDYIDINADGRSLKISSQSNKSNNVDLSDSQTNNLKNIYDGDTYAGRNGGIQNLMNACVTNEDAGIDYITELDKVDAKWKDGSAAEATLPTSSSIYGLVFSTSDNSGNNYPVLRFEKVTSSIGTPTTFKALTDTPENFNNANQTGNGKLVQVANTDPGELGFTHLTNNHLATYAESDVESTPFFAVAATDEGGDDKFIRLKSLGEMMLEDTDEMKVEDVAHAAASFDDHFVLSVTDDGTKTKFKNIKFLSQLGGVSKGFDFDAESPEATTCNAVLTKEGNFGNFSVQFQKTGDILESSPTNITDKEQANSFFLVKSGGEGGKLQTATLDPSLFGGGGPAGDGSVKYVDGTNNTPGTLQFKRGAGFGGDPAVSYLNYQPKLFGICKEDGSYEYRYFLTSVPVTTS